MNKLRNWIKKIVQEVVKEAGFKDWLDNIEKRVGDHSSDYRLTDNSIRKAITLLEGSEWHERQADLNEAPLAERVKKLEEYLGITFSIGTTRGYKKVKKSNPPKKKRSPN